MTGSLDGAEPILSSLSRLVRLQDGYRGSLLFGILLLVVLLGGWDWLLLSPVRCVVINTCGRLDAVDVEGLTDGHVGR